MVQEEMGKSQREYILRQQMKSIKEELGEGGDDDEIEELRERIRRAKVPAEVDKVVRKQLSRLRSMAQQSAEFNVTKTYLEWIADLPWSARSDAPSPVTIRWSKRKGSPLRIASSICR